MREGIITIFYQIDCAFCNACRRFIERRDSKRRCLFKNIAESEYARGKTKGFETIVVVVDKKIYTKFSACLCIGERLQNPWPYITWVLKALPRPLGDWGYDLVSHKRKFLMRFLKE